jgi:hypothetical protein
MWTYPELRAGLAPYGALDDAQAAAALQAETVIIPGAIARDDAVREFLRAGVWGVIQVRADRPFNTTASAETINAQTAAAKNVLDAVLLFDAFDLTDSSLYSALQRDLDVLVAAGDITTQQRNAILAARDKTVAKWLPAPTAADVAYARSLG